MPEEEEGAGIPEYVSLRDYVEQRLDAAERTVENARHALADQVQQRFSATQNAIDKAEVSVSERLQTITSTLGALGVRVEAFVTRQEVAALLEKFDLRNAENLQRQFQEAEQRSQIHLDGLVANHEASRRELDIWREGLKEQMRLINQATEKAAEAMNKRLEAGNDYRIQLREQNSTFITRHEFQAQIAGLIDGRERLADSLGSVASRVELAALAEKIDAVESAIDKAEGRRTVTTAIVALGSSLIVSLISGVIFFALNHK